MSKTINTVIKFLCVFILMSCEKGEVRTGGYVEGKHYKTLENIQASNIKQVLFFFSAACSSCRDFDQLLKHWESQREKSVVFERIPVTFNRPEWTLLSQIYATSRNMGAHDEVLKSLFSAIQDENIFWSENYQVVKWLSSHDLALEKVDEFYRSNLTEKLIRRYSTAEEKYLVRAIPKLIINGNIELNLGYFKDIGKDIDDREKRIMFISKEITKVINALLKS